MRLSIGILLVNLVVTVLSAQDKFLIELSDNEPAVWKTESEVFDLIKEGKHFFDITEHPNSVKYQPNSRMATVIPTTLNYGKVVKQAQRNICKNDMSNFLEKYSSFYNRYYQSKYGVEAVDYLFKQVNKAGHGYKGNFTANLVKHSWAQNSIISRIEGTTNKEEIVIIGAHLDSLNLKDPENGKAPGADDDGSGTTAALETLKAIVKSNLKFKRSIEFQFYAAEELGLKGSQDIAQSYAKQSKNVVGMLQLDMTGYNEKKQIKLLTDYTDPELNQFVKLIIDNYSSYKWFEDKCGRGCSDHASFFRAGYKSSQPGEDVTNKRLHTTEDTTQFINYDHVKEFVKLALGFAIELAEPIA